MVALRKDVKLGLTLGGIVLSVVGVYVGLSALAGDSSNGNGSGAPLMAEGTPASGSKSTAVVSNPTNTGTPPPTRIDNPQATDPTMARVNQTNAEPPVGPGSVAMNQPLNTPAPANGGSVDPWDTAFSSGQLSGTPSVTQTPTPGGVATNQPRTGPTQAPSDIINSLQNPPTNTSGSTTVTPPPAGTNIATIRDGSGNLTGPNTTSTLTTQSPAAGESKHVVANGETLSTIAAEHYGSSKYFQLIADANPSVNPNRLKIGQELRIPARPANAEPSNAAAASAQLANGTIDPTRQYVVKGNDSLHKIASTLYGDSGQWERIYNANKAQIGNDPARLKLGMVLTLPEAPTQR